MASIDYKKSGVDIELADRFVNKIQAMTKKTQNNKVRSGVGGFASLYALDSKQWIAASTDGVGTKLKMAFQSGDHSTIGIDLVAMCANDLICVGAEPLFFLDYFATGKLDTKIGESVISGIIEGCKQAGMALVGGETAEMPDFYKSGEYDLAGFAVGKVAAKDVLPKKTIKPGDRLIGLSSSGFHSNGYSLIRKMLEMDKTATPSVGGDSALIEKLLCPTKIYVKSMMPLLKKNLIKGMAHITGSGFLNIPRISDQVSYEIDLPEQHLLPGVFSWVRERSTLKLHELLTTFNMGIGMVLVVDPKDEKKVMASLKTSREKAFVIGEVLKKPKGEPSQVVVKEGDSMAILDY